MAVALAQAKARLSELVKLANAGEEVTITSRGKPVANGPLRKLVDLSAFEAIAVEAPYQTQSAGDFVAELRAADLLG